MPRRPRHIIVTRRWPQRYFTGLTPTQRAVREGELLRRRLVAHPKMGRTNTLAKRRPSRWTQKFHDVYPGLPFKKNAIARRTGIPIQALDTVYNRGLKAWKTSGSRVGASAHQWAVARVYKFVLVTKKKVPAAWYVTRYDPDQNVRSKLYM